MLDRIQQVVDEKADVKDVRSATVTDFIYAIILYYFKIQSNIPMSTTWVFLGLLAGWEIAMSLRDAGGKAKPIGISLKLIGRDVGYALIGLAVPIALAVTINEEIKVDIWNFFFG